MTYDAIIIGFGKGGKTLAGRLAARGQKVALIERSDKMYGGTCINVGCIPSKSLVHSAAESALDADASFEKKANRYAAAIAEKRHLTGMLRGKNYAKVADSAGAEVLHGTARFADPHTVIVTMAQSGEERSLTAPRIFINTGATPVMPRIEGTQGNAHVFTSETLMELDTLPRRLAVIGGGYIGMEFASMYAAFGSKVTVLQDGDVFLPREDTDVAQTVRELLAAQGVSFVLGAAVKRVEENGAVAYTDAQGEHLLEADAVLLATGRRPNTDGLALEKAGVAVTPRGAVQVDEFLRTSQPHIWAMGDVTGGLQFTYMSLDDYRIVAPQVDGTDATPRSTKAENRTTVPYSVFMATPLSRVGVTEAQARAEGKNIKVAKLPVAAIPKAQVLRRPFGLLKAVIDADTGAILGASLLCEESYEMINIIKLAMDMGAPYTTLRDQIFTHPTMSEALNDLFNV